jgi:hypothetical protein
MNSEPLINVAVPAYNHGRFVIHCAARIHRRLESDREDRP